ncbi:MAG: N-acetylmuramoyl-L-alanine amidase family protein [Clostridia bacterium]|nr:N-acetylmuramoyl-L-alanine amidase family protein [Clostridia bacterium]
MKKKRNLAALFVFAAVFAAVLFTPGTAAAETDFTNPVLSIQEPMYDEETGTIYLGEDGLEAYTLDPYGAGNLAHWANSKKGIQENDYLMDADYQALGVKHVLINIVMSNSIVYENGSYRLADVADAVDYQPLVRKLNAEGVKVTAVLLYRWTENPNLQNLIYPSGRQGGHLFYNLNCEDAGGKAAWKNIFDKLISNYGKSDCHIDNWILGNEVNQTGNTSYNYTGVTDLDTNVRAYANVFKVLNQSIADKYSSARSYISFDHNWNGTDTGLPSKNYLDTFASYMGSGQWGVAWHPYAPSLSSVANTSWDNMVIWNSPGVTNSASTKYVCGSNLNILTDYIKNNWGSSHRVLLSEQGYDARGNETYQSAFIAYTFYAAQFNDMVDGVMFRAYLDAEDEDGLKLGIIAGTRGQMQASGDKAAFVNTRKRPAYDVFKYMDTDSAASYTQDSLNAIGVGEWSDIVPNYGGPTSVGTWKQEGSNWYVVRNGKNVTGWLLYKNVWYYLDPARNGAMATGPCKAEGNWYYFDGNGVMQSSGWRSSGNNWYYLQSNGMAQTGWLVSGNKWYYMDPSSAVMCTGWYKVGSTWYLSDGNGVMQSGGWRNLGGRWYYLQSNGAAKTGWLNQGGKWYYMDPSSAAMCTGWFKDGATWYFADGSGVMQSNTWKASGSRWYYLQSSGAAKTGWLKLGNTWYYMDPSSAAMQTGWLKDGGAWYYLDGSGAMASNGWRAVGGRWYYLQSSGAAKTGWLRLGNTWYYMDPGSAAMRTGWLQEGASLYYLNGSGAMQSGGWRYIGGAWYYLQSSGAAKTGWLNLGGTWYYMDPGSAAMKTGWFNEGAVRYYADGSGAMQSGGWKSIGNKWYWFESSGALHTGWLNVGSTRYYLDPSSGAMVTGNTEIDGVAHTFAQSGAMVS